MILNVKGAYRCYLHQTDDSCLVEFGSGTLRMSGKTPSIAYANNPDWSLYMLTYEITTVIVEKDITVIPQEFMWVNKVKYLYLEDSVESIGKKAFQSNSIEILRIPKSCKIIGSEAFAKNRELKKVYIPSNVTLRSNAFEDCGDFTLYYDGDTEPEIEHDVFLNSKPTIIVPRNYTGKKFGGIKVIAGVQDTVILLTLFFIFILI